jgi:hypothetical protein
LPQGKSPQQVMTPAVADPAKLGYLKLYKMMLDMVRISARCCVHGFFYTCTCGADSCVPVGFCDDCALVDALQSMRQIARALRIFAYQENLPIMVHCIHGEVLAMK